MQLDDTDRQIVQLLAEDGRATYSQISQAVGVSVGTVRNRITAMRESGALHMNVWLDPYKLGLGITATFLMRIEGGSIDRVTEEITALDSTGYIAVIAGDHDLMVDAFFRDVPHLNHVLHEVIETIEGVISVTSYLITDIRYDSSLNLNTVLSTVENGHASRQKRGRKQ